MKSPPQERGKLQKKMLLIKKFPEKWEKIRGEVLFKYKMENSNLWSENEITATRKGQAVEENAID